jgi:hypothetical protein
MTNLIDAPAEWGIVGVVVTAFGFLLTWLRRDTVRAQRLAEEALEAHSAYLEKSLARQTEVLVAVANGLERLDKESRHHEDRAQQRHEQILHSLNGRGP